jgi:hypothetical protein
LFAFIVNSTATIITPRFEIHSNGGVFFMKIRASDVRTRVTLSRLLDKVAQDEMRGKRLGIQDVSKFKPPEPKEKGSSRC